MKNIKNTCFIICFCLLSVQIYANESIIKISLNNGADWVYYKSINEFTNNIHIKSTIKSTTLILHDKNLVINYPTFKDAVSNLKIVNCSRNIDNVIPKSQNCDSIKKIDISIYPNPFNDVINLHFIKGGEYKVILYDIYHNQAIEKLFSVKPYETIVIPFDLLLEQSIWEIIVYNNNKLLLTKNLVRNIR